MVLVSTYWDILRSTQVNVLLIYNYRMSAYQSEGSLVFCPLGYELLLAIFLSKVINEIPLHMIIIIIIIIINYN